MYQKLKNTYHLAQAFLANIWYGFPSRRLKVIGITGTDGKTTITSLIYHILKESGHKVSMISTVYAKIGDIESDIGFHVTTPNPFSIQKYLKQSMKNGDEYFVLETTSHALDQNRVWGIKYEIGVISNITHEHLDYHKTYEEYIKAKEKLISMAKLGILNEDDASFKLLSQKTKLKSLKYNSHFDGVEKFSKLTKFNQYNYAAAYKVAKVLGIKDEDIINALNSFKLPKGRLELVYDREFKVIIDFAHTPNAFLQLLPEIRKSYLEKQGRLIHVFGSAGLRDSSKRPLMGEASGKYSDLVILTEEDYRSEDPAEISSQIETGLKKNDFEKVGFDILKNFDSKHYSVVLNREKAIKEAIKLAKRGDTIVITGKSHEKSLARGDKEYPWSEYEAVKKALKP